jgi:hypothetical protein
MVDGRLTVDKLKSYVAAEIARAGLRAEEQSSFMRNLEAALMRTKASDADLECKLCTSPALFTALRDLMGSAAGAAVQDAAPQDVPTKAQPQRSKEVQVAPDEESPTNGTCSVRRTIRRSLANLATSSKDVEDLETRFAAAKTRTQAVTAEVRNCVEALTAALGKGNREADELRSLEEGLLSLESSGLEDFFGMGASFSAEDVQELRQQVGDMDGLAILAQQAHAALSATNTESSPRSKKG